MSIYMYVMKRVPNVEKPYITHLDDQHVNHPDVSDMCVFHKFLSHFCTASFGGDFKSKYLYGMWDLRKWRQ